MASTAAHPRRTGRRASAAAALVTAALAAGAAGCGGTPTVMSRADIAAAPALAGASPEHVVTAYLGALQEWNPEVTRALMTDGYAAHGGASLTPPFEDDVTVSSAVPCSTTGTAAQGHRDAVYVPVRLTVHGGDDSMPDGPLSWGYVVVRDQDGGPWRIAGSGVG